VAIEHRRSPGFGGRPDRRRSSDNEGVESNSRLTVSLGAVLLVLLVAEGVTVPQARSLLSAHVFIGMLAVPPTLLKMGSTGWRFVRYYRGAPAYRRKGPPPVLLRVLGPAVVLATLVLLGSGIALLTLPHSWRQPMKTVHLASFILWFGVMAIHVLGHIVETARVAPLDWARRTRHDVAGAGARQWSVAASVMVGVALAVVMLGPASHYRHL
jgi:hypothetical protein